MILFFMFSIFPSYTLLEKRDYMEKKVSFEKELSFPDEITEVTSISLDHDLQLEEQTVEGSFTISGTYQVKDTLEKESFHEVIPCTIAIDPKYDASQVLFDIDDFYYEIPTSQSVLVHIDVKLQNLVEVQVPEEVEVISTSSRIEDDAKEEGLQPMKEDPLDNVQLEEEEKKPLEDREAPLEEPVASMEENTELLELTDQDLTDAVPNQEMISNSTPQKENIIFPAQPIPVEVTNLGTDKSESSDLPSIFSNLADSSDTFCKYHVYIMRESDTLENVISKYQTSRDALAEYNDLDTLPVGSKLIVPSNHE